MRRGGGRGRRGRFGVNPGGVICRDRRRREHTSGEGRESFSRVEEGLVEFGEGERRVEDTGKGVDIGEGARENVLSEFAVDEENIGLFGGYSFDPVNWEAVKSMERKKEVDEERGRKEERRDLKENLFKNDWRSVQRSLSGK